MEIEPSETIVTQIMPLSYINAAQIAKDMKDLVPKYGVMVAHTQSNTLIITASSSNIKRFARIIKELDIPISDLIKVEVFFVNYPALTDGASCFSEGLNSKTSWTPFSTSFNSGSSCPTTQRSDSLGQSRTLTR